MNKSIGIKLQGEAIKDVYDMFVPVEGAVSFYYGRIRNGKTYAATADILQLLSRGECVFANWNVDFSGYDERDSLSLSVVKLFGGRDRFFKYTRDNFHYFHPDEIDIAYLGRLVNAHIFIDEGQWIFNSHVKDQDPEKRRLILHNGHYCRSLNIISQRPRNVFLDMRSQINFWYKCEKRLSWPWIVFERTTFEDLKDDLPDEENPSGHKVYFADKRVFKAYDTHAMRSGDAIQVMPEFEVFELKTFDKLRLIGSHLNPFGRRSGGLPPPAAYDEADEYRSSGQIIASSKWANFNDVKTKPL